MANSETVTVGCKWPPGIVLRVYGLKTSYEPVLGGGSREVKVAELLPTGDIVVNGPQVPFGAERPFAAEAGFALTHGVPKDVWDLWYQQNKDSDLVRNNLIFANGSEASVKSQARENEDAATGMERKTAEEMTDGRVTKAPRKAK